MSRISPELRHLDYPGRLRILKITTLETRRVRADLLEVFKIINVLDIHKLHSRFDIRKYSFTQRIVNDWNRLRGSAVMSASVNQFKGHIDKYLRNRPEDYTSQRLTPFLVNSSTT